MLGSDSFCFAVELAPFVDLALVVGPNCWVLLTPVHGKIRRSGREVWSPLQDWANPAWIPLMLVVTDSPMDWPATVSGKFAPQFVGWCPLSEMPVRFLHPQLFQVVVGRNLFRGKTADVVADWILGQMGLHLGVYPGGCEKQRCLQWIPIF